MSCTSLSFEEVAQVGRMKARTAHVGKVVNLAYLNKLYDETVEAAKQAGLKVTPYKDFINNYELTNGNVRFEF